MLAPALDDLTVEHLQRLIEAGAPEKQEMEFKRQLEPQNTNHKKKFLAEVTSFANSTGGDLIIGVPDPDDIDEDEEGELWWTTDYDPDDYKLRWENITRNNTDPRLQTHDIRTIPNPDGSGFVTVVRVQSSMTSPHRVTIGSREPFYARNSAGKYPLDTRQLREKFIEQYNLREEIEDFLAERITKIRSGDTPAPYKPGPSMVLHIIPANAFGLQLNFNLSAEDNNYDDLHILHRNYGSGRYGGSRRNVDGVVKSQDIAGFRQASSDSDPASEYIQVFNDGKIETVHSLAFRTDQTDGDQVGFQTLYQIFNDRLSGYVDFLTGRGASPPLFMYLSIIDAKGFVMFSDQNRTSDELDRNVATLPVVTLESEDIELDDVTEALMRHVWHAFGELGDPFDTS